MTETTRQVTGINRSAVLELATRCGWTTTTGRLNTAAMARDLGMSNPTVNRVWNERRGPSAEFVTAFMRYAPEGTDPRVYFTYETADTEATS